MSRIKGKDTIPEKTVRSLLHHAGFRFCLNRKDLPGSPDIILPKYKTVIFVHGCFWHGHEGYPCFVLPKTKTEWWQNKIERTQKRDLQHIKDLKQKHWNVITIWECQLKPKKKEQTLFQLSVIISQYILDYYKRQKYSDT